MRWPPAKPEGHNTLLTWMCFGFLLGLGFGLDLDARGGGPAVIWLLGMALVCWGYLMAEYSERQP